MCNRDWWEGGVGKKLFNPKIKMSKVLSEFLDLPLLNVGLLQQFKGLYFLKLPTSGGILNVPSKHVLHDHPSSHLICILFCPIISKRNVMNIVILAQIPHHIIMSSKQVLHVAMETPTSAEEYNQYYFWVS